MHTRVAGVWQTVTAPSVRVAGTWRTVTEGWVRVVGVWQQFFAALSIVLSGRTVAALGFQSVSDAIAGIRVSSDTALYTRINSTYAAITGEWMSPSAGAAASDYECMMTNNTGTAPSGSALGTWLSCSTTRDWHVTKANATAGTVSSSNTLEIRLAASPFTVLATATIGFDATVEA